MIFFFLHSNFLLSLCEIQIQETQKQLLLLTPLTKQSQVTRECRLVLPATAVQLHRAFVVIAISTMKELQRAEIANKQHKEHGLFFPHPLFLSKETLSIKEKAIPFTQVI